MLDLHKTFAAAALMAAGVLALQPQAASAESVLRIAMTAGDIPDWTGQPDQGFEGYRFVGFALYDGLVNWDLSRSDREADIKPALATKWSADPGDLKKWIMNPAAEKPGTSMPNVGLTDDEATKIVAFLETLK